MVSVDLQRQAAVGVTLPKATDERRVGSCGLLRMQEGVKHPGRAGSARAGWVRVFVIGSPFGDGSLDSSGQERHYHRDAAPMSISQRVETHNKNRYMYRI